MPLKGSFYQGSVPGPLWGPEGNEEELNSENFGHNNNNKRTATVFW